MTVNRMEVLADGLAILLGAQLAPNVVPNEQFGFYDDDVIRQYTALVQGLVDNLPPELGKRMVGLAYKLEGDKEAIGSNGSLCHALALELFGQTVDFLYDDGTISVCKHVLAGTSPVQHLFGTDGAVRGAECSTCAEDVEHGDAYWENQSSLCAAHTAELNIPLTMPGPAESYRLLQGTWTADAKPA
jgi:hypothetical protein